GKGRAGGRAVAHRAPRRGLRAGPRARLEDAGADPAAAVRGGHPGLDRQPRDRTGNGEGAAQERARQVLRRRHYAQAQAAREAEGREEADEARRTGRDPAGSLPCGPEGRNRMMSAQRTKQPAPPAEPYRKSTAREYFESIAIAVILALFIRTFVVQAFKIPTGSMENNLLIGDHLLVNKFVYGPTATAAERMLLPIDPIRRGDVIVFKFPEDPERDFIKRTIGLPGDTVELRNKKAY